MSRVNPRRFDADAVTSKLGTTLHAIDFVIQIYCRNNGEYLMLWFFILIVEFGKRKKYEVENALVFFPLSFVDFCFILISLNS